MRSNAGMANKEGDVNLLFAQVDVAKLNLWFSLAWLGNQAPLIPFVFDLSLQELER